MATARTAQFEEVLEYRKGEFVLSTDRKRLDLGLIYGFLRECYWAKDIPRDVVERSIDHSLCFGVYADGRQVGFARVISDLATYAYIGDVFVLNSFRRRGLGKWLMECIMRDPRLQGLRRWSLVTGDAHRLYAQFGFKELATGAKHMEIHCPNVYQLKASE